VLSDLLTLGATEMVEALWNGWQRIAPLWGIIFFVAALAGWWNGTQSSERRRKVCDDISYLRDYRVGGDDISSMADRCSNWFAEPPPSDQ
jgi:hypothetical protein